MEKNLDFSRLFDGEIPKDNFIDAKMFQTIGYYLDQMVSDSDELIAILSEGHYTKLDQYVMTNANAKKVAVMVRVLAWAYAMKSEVDGQTSGYN